MAERDINCMIFEKLDKMSEEFATVHEEIASVRKEMNAGFAAVRKEMDAGIADVRKKMDAEFATVHEEIASVRKEMDVEFAAVRKEMDMVYSRVVEVYPTTDPGKVIDEMSDRLYATEHVVTDHSKRIAKLETTVGIA